METPATYDGRAISDTQTRRQHRDAIDAALRDLDHTATPESGSDGGQDERRRVVRTYLLDVASLTLDDLDADTVQWLDCMVGWDVDAMAGLAAFVDAAKARGLP